MSRMGQRIREIRTSKGMSQKQLAKSLGVTEKFVADIESGKRILNDQLIRGFSRVLQYNLDEVSIYLDSEHGREEKANIADTPGKQEVQEVWREAFSSVLKAVPVYGYSLDKAVGVRQMPVISNKVEGYPKDKVLFLEIEDNEMLGFRMLKGDIAFGYLSQEIESNTFYLLEHDGRRMVRQIKKLDDNRLLLVSNGGRLATETASVKDVKVLVRLERLEIKL